MIDNFPASITEGEMLPRALKAKVLSESGSPLEGIPCFVSITSKGDDDIPLDYKPLHNKMKMKEILYSQAGLYSFDSLNPLAISQIEFHTSDKNGFISFPHVKFSVWGQGNLWYST